MKKIGLVVLVTLWVTTGTGFAQQDWDPAGTPAFGTEDTAGNDAGTNGMSHEGHNRASGDRVARDEGYQPPSTTIDHGRKDLMGSSSSSTDDGKTRPSVQRIVERVVEQRNIHHYHTRIIRRTSPAPTARNNNSISWLKRQLVKYVERLTRRIDDHEKRINALEGRTPTPATPAPQAPVAPVQPSAPPVQPQAPSAPQPQSPGATPIPAPNVPTVPGAGSQSISFVRMDASQPVAFRQAIWLVGEDEGQGQIAPSTLTAYCKYNESPVSGVEITLCDASGTPFQNRGVMVKNITGPGGGVRFDGFPAGEYTVRLTGQIPGGLFPLAATEPIGKDGQVEVTFELVDAQWLVDQTASASATAVIEALKAEGYIVAQPKPVPVPQPGPGDVKTPTRDQIFWSIWTILILLLIVGGGSTLVRWYKNRPEKPPTTDSGKPKPPAGK